MAQIMGFISFLISIYMVIIFIRIILTWFSGTGTGRFQEILAMITDPYLNWFRRFTFLRTGFLDFSPIVALGVLSLINRIFTILAYYNTISIGIILIMMLQIVWGIISFFLGFLIIVLVLRLIAYLAKQNLYNPFWRIINTIAQPVLYRINRILFRDRIVNFRTLIIISIVGLGILYVILRLLLSLVSAVLAGLPF